MKLFASCAFVCVLSMTSCGGSTGPVCAPAGTYAGTTSLAKKTCTQGDLTYTPQTLKDTTAGNGEVCAPEVTEVIQTKDGCETKLTVTITPSATGLSGKATGTTTCPGVACDLEVDVAFTKK